MPPIRSMPERATLASYGSPTWSTPMPIDYPKKRAAVACEVCRQRKSRCDGQKPRCAFCKEIDQDCQYRPAPPAAPSKLEQDIWEILRRFDMLENLIRNQRQPALMSPEPNYNLNSIDIEHPKALKPEETNATEAPKNNLPYRLHKAADILFRFPIYLSQGLTYPGVPFPIFGPARTLPTACPRDINRYSSYFFVADERLLIRYFEKVHFWFPFLDPAYIQDKFINITPSLTSDYCMFLLIMALGSLAEKERIDHDGQQWARYWAEPAFSMIPMITMQDDLTAVHCLILFSLYHMWILNPSHAYNMICVASEKMQNIIEKYSLLSQFLRTHRHLKSPKELSLAAKITREIEKRAYWIIYIIDNEHRGLFVDKGSGIEAYEDMIELPYSFEVPSQDSDRNLPYQQASFFFLGCISMRKTCNRAKYTRKHGTPVAFGTMRLTVVEEESEQLKYNVGSALDIETEVWYQNLPPIIRFDRDIKVDIDPAYGRLAPLVEDNVAWLRSSYMAIPAMAYWEPVFSAATTELTDERREAVIKWQLSFMKYVASTHQYLDGKFHPLVWTQSQTY